MSTPLRLALTAAALGVLAAAPPASAKFVYGVAAGEVSSTGAKVWTRATTKGAVEVRVGTSRGALRRAAVVTASTSHDLTLTAALRRLKPDTKYFYDFRQGSVPPASERSARRPSRPPPRPSASPGRATPTRSR